MPTYDPEKPRPQLIARFFPPDRNTLFKVRRMPEGHVGLSLAQRYIAPNGTIRDAYVELASADLDALEDAIASVREHSASSAAPSGPTEVRDGR